MQFSTGKNYSRANVKEAAGLSPKAKGSNWDTGLVEHNGEFVIFTNIETEGRTGHNYGNKWKNNALIWYHKTKSHLGWASVQRLLMPDQRIHLFWRNANTDLFTYAGLATALEVHDSSPVEILWSFSKSTMQSMNAGVVNPEEISEGLYREGFVRQIHVNAYERDPNAREACIAKYGCGCAVCGFRFEERYGDLGAGFIHIHHLKPLSELLGEYLIDPVNDMRPVCPNCHAMLHRRNPILSVLELKGLLKCANSG
jgi:5-methylcytosine-specific restriction protein A